MNTELVDKYVNGDIDEATFNAELDKLEPAQKTAAIKEAEDKEFAKLKAFRKARQVEEAKIEAAKNAPPPPDFVTKFRQSQVKKGMDKLFTEFGIEEAERSAYEQELDKMAAEEVDPDLIYSELRKIYGARNVDRLVTDARASGASGADAFNSRGAGAAGAAGAPPASAQIDPRIAQLMAEARRQGISMTEDEAKRGITASDAQRFGGWKKL